MQCGGNIQPDNTFDYINAANFVGSAIVGTGIQTRIVVGTSGTAIGYVNTATTDNAFEIEFRDSAKQNLRVSDPIYVRVENPSSNATLTITGQSTPAALGTIATFTISADPVADKDILVPVRLNDLVASGTDFIEEETRYVRIPANESEVTIEVPTLIPYETVQEDGNDVERQALPTNDGIIVATLENNTGYTPDPSNNVANVEVQDLRIKNPVVVSVSANSPAYYVGEMLSLTISRTGDTTNKLDFWYDLVETEDIIDGDGEGILGEIPANRSSIPISALVKADTSGSYDPDDGVTLRLISVAENTAATYRVAAPASVKVGVSSDAIPEITLSAPNYIEEGESFNLVATASGTTIRATAINVTLSSDSNDTFLESGSRGAQTIRIAAGETSGFTSITSLAGGNSLNKGTITAQLETGSGYTRPVIPADQMTSVVTLESKPVISMSVVNPQVREDVGTFELVLDSDTFTPDAGQPINITGLTAANTGSTHNYLGTVNLTAVQIDETGQARVSIPVTPTPTGTYEGWGEITFTLVNGDEYDSSFRELRVIIEEVQTHPTRTVEISAPDSVIEGENIDVTFRNSSGVPITETINVAFKIVANPERFWDSANTDITPIPIISPNASATVTIPTFDDPTLTESGTIDITVIRGDGYEPAAIAPKRVQIIAKEAIPIVSVNRVSSRFIDEGEDAVFAVAATGALSRDLPVAVTVTQGTSDFIDTIATPLPTSVNVLSMTNTGEIKLVTIADSIDESNGMITVTLGASSNNSYALGTDTTRSIEVRDNDDDTLPEIAITQTGPTPVVEGDPLTFALTAANPSLTGDAVVQVNVRVTETGNFLATPAKDNPQLVTVAVGSSGGTLSLPTTADGDDESNAKVSVRLIGEDTSAGSATYSIGATTSIEVDIHDNDDPALASINIVPVSATVAEAAGAMAQFNVTATVGSAGDTTAFDVDLIISEVGNFLQNKPTPGTPTRVRVTPGIDGSETPTVHAEPIEDDSDYESNGTIIAKIVNSTTYAVGANARAEVEISDVDPIPTVSITGPANVAEGNSGTTDYDFAVSLSNASSEDIVVNFTVGKEDKLDDQGMVTEAGDTATLNDDYTVGNATTSLVFPAGTTGPQNINIDVVGDALNETDEEFTITLSLPAGATGVSLPNPTTTGTITNDDTAPVVRISNASGAEGNGTSNGSIEFEVSLSKPSGLPVKVNYATADGTGDNPATTPGTDDDYETVTAGTLTIEPSTNSVHNITDSITITTNADDTAEEDETFTVTLTLPSDANAVSEDLSAIPPIMAQLVATGTILDDDTTPALTIAEPITGFAESRGSVDFVVSSTRARTLTVRYQAAEVSGGDFLTIAQEQATEAELTFVPSGSSGTYTDTLNVSIDDDGNGEVTGQIMVTLLAETGGATNYTVPAAGSENLSATATIWDDDTPELAIGSRTTVSESDGMVEFTVLARVSPDGMVEVNYELVENSDGDGDFIADR